MREQIDTTTPLFSPEIQDTVRAFYDMKDEITEKRNIVSERGNAIQEELDRRANVVA
jgi:hypothetical protein